MFLKIFPCLKDKKLETEKDKKEQEIAGVNGVSGNREDCFVGALDHAKAENDFQALQEKTISRKKMLHFFSIVFVILMMIAASVAVYFRDKNSNQAAAAIEQAASQTAAVSNQNTAIVNDVTGVSAVDTVVESENELRGIAGKSESYFIRDISIGGGNIVLAADDEALPLKVTDVHSDTLMTKDGKKSEVVISWKTNKLAKSTVKYAKDAAGSEKSIKEDGYGFAHAFAVNNLEQSTRYLFTVVAVDRSGNSVTSGQLAVFTGTKPISVIDLISAQMGDIFGWALK